MNIKMKGNGIRGKWKKEKD
jgi:hypothetical protein